MPRRFPAVVLVTFVLASALVARPAAEIIEQVLVKVNGDILTKTELEQRQVMALRQRNFQLTSASQEALSKALAEITPQLIVEFVDETLLMQRGRELGYKMGDEDFQRIVTQIRKENKLESDEAYQAALKQEGMTVADLRKNLEKQMLITRVQQAEVIGRIGVTEDEARAYHAAHLKDFTQPAQVTLREIMVAVPTSDRGLNVAEDEAARAKAEGARKRILAGEAFETVASEVSSAASRANGGLIGPLAVSELSAAARTLIESLKPGEMTGVLRAPAGYQLLKLEALTPDVVLPPEKVHDQIADRLFDQKRRAELRKYLVKLRGQATIEWKNEELRKAYELGQKTLEQDFGATPAPPPAS